MRHQLSHRKLSRSMSHRKALLRSLVTAIVTREQVRTTLPKAKELRPLVEKFVTLARVDNLHNRRQAYAFLFDKGAVQKLFTDLGPRFKNRNGGYTRIIRTDFRKGDAAEMAVIEFVEKGTNTSGKLAKDSSETVTEGDSTSKKAAPKKVATKKATASEDGDKKATKKSTSKTTSKKSDKKD